MNRTFAIVIVIAAALCLMTGCSSSASSNRYIAAEAQPNEPTPTVSEQPTETVSPQSDTQASPTQSAEPAQAEPSQQAANSEEPTPEKSNESAKKQTKAQKVQEAKKNNESIGKAVTDSILDNSADQAAATGAEAERLKKAIEQIRALVKDLKQHADSNDAANMKTVSSQIAQAWEAMKADVDASYSDMTDFLQQKIDKLDELQASETIDSKAMLQIDYELYQGFRQLADKAGV